MHHAAFDAPLWSLAPFVLLLLGIAVLPLVAPLWWLRERNQALLSGLCAAPVAAWLLSRSPAALWHSLGEYASFMALLGSLFVISGGIHLAGDLRATPGRNTLLLGAGAVLANLLGTTGASVVLIRLVLRTNQQRRNVGHLPFFFILLVSNAGGLLTPFGDPPLFLGFLRGVPFGWTLRLWPIWLLAVGYLLSLFYVVDRRAYAREAARDVERDEAEVEPLRIVGLSNAALLLGVLGAAFVPSPFREIAMLSLAGVSYLLGSRPARELNRFGFGPIVEVALLFGGIFVTMVPALALVQAHAGALGLGTPWQFLVTTGLLSSVLDNAPTYVTFLSAAQGLGLPDEVIGVPHVFLEAISIGAVLMGANTYIGNGPNFMVKAIASSSGYATASFGRHAFWAVIVLLPVYVAAALYVSR